MPTSLKQLEQRYKNVCDNIRNAKDFTLQHLNQNIVMDLGDFFNNLDTADLKKCDEELEKIQDSITQCRNAVKYEESRRSLAEDITHKTNKNTEKTLKKYKFKLDQKESSLRRSSPYPLRSNSIGH